jgi:hypothetical protein
MPAKPFPNQLVGLEGNNLRIIPEASSAPDQISDYARGTAGT